MKDLTALIKSGSNSPHPKNFEFPYLIAEAGVNHEGDIDLARRLIDEAKEGGADAIKFQTYKASTIASKNSPSYWDLTKERPAPLKSGPTDRAALEGALRSGSRTLERAVGSWQRDQQALSGLPGSLLPIACLNARQQGEQFKRKQ